MGWGQLFGKISDYVQGRSERRRNDISKIEGQMDEITQKPIKTPSDIDKYAKLSRRLSELQKQAKND